jgi:hypothetical protein
LLQLLDNEPLLPSSPAEVRDVLYDLLDARKPCTCSSNGRHLCSQCGEQIPSL